MMYMQKKSTVSSKSVTLVATCWAGRYKSKPLLGRIPPPRHCKLRYGPQDRNGNNPQAEPALLGTHMHTHTHSVHEEQRSLGVDVLQGLDGLRSLDGVATVDENEVLGVESAVT